jgi:hypothetical protein
MRQIPMARTALALALLLWATPTPARALEITDPRLWCGSTPMAGLVDLAGCQALTVTLRVAGFPVSSAPTLALVVTLDGQTVHTATVPLPADLGPVPGASCAACPLVNGVPHYHTLGLALTLDLPGECCWGQLVPALATVGVGGPPTEVAFTLTQTPAPVAWPLFAAMLAVAWWTRRGR